MFPKNLFIRNIQAIEHFESFFISAVSSLFTIRLFLFITKYPQLGGSGLHIAHMLWGGLLMFCAIFIMFTFLSRTVLRIGAIIGGIGFGAFIDELGKFITSDNNYFFQPTIAIIYVIFVFLYLLSRSIPRYRAYSEKEYLINALDMTKEAVINDLDIEEERLALEYLQYGNANDPIVQSLLQLLDKIDAVKAGKDGFITRVRKVVRRLYYKFTKSQFIARIVVIPLIVQSLTAIGFAIYIIVSKLVISFDKWGVLITAMIATFYIFRGVLFLRRSKAFSYKQFKTAVLILILLTQFFLFYSVQFQALITLGLNIGILMIIDYVLSIEGKETTATLLQTLKAKKK